MDGLLPLLCTLAAGMAAGLLFGHALSPPPRFGRIGALMTGALGAALASQLTLPLLAHGVGRSAELAAGAGLLAWSAALGAVSGAMMTALAVLMAGRAR